jgi:hypothetical protein
MWQIWNNIPGYSKDSSDMSSDNDDDDDVRLSLKDCDAYLWLGYMRTVCCPTFHMTAAGII